MIKVTKKGEVPQNKFKYVFECDNCGEQWEATRESITIEQSNFNALDVFYICKCPECKRTIYNGKKVEGDLSE